MPRWLARALDGVDLARLRFVDDVVAVEVELQDGEKRYFLTWGRVLDAVDGAPIAQLVLRHAAAFSIDGEPARARLCQSLREAADSDSAPYYYECLLRFSREPIPFGDGFEDWRHERAGAMERGDELAYCGSPKQVSAEGTYPYVTVN